MTTDQFSDSKLAFKKACFNWTWFFHENKKVVKNYIRIIVLSSLFPGIFHDSYFLRDPDIRALLRVSKILDLLLLAQRRQKWMSEKNLATSWIENLFFLNRHFYGHRLQKYQNRKKGVFRNFSEKWDFTGVKKILRIFFFQAYLKIYFSANQIYPKLALCKIRWRNENLFTFIIPNVFSLSLSLSLFQIQKIHSTAR